MLDSILANKRREVIVLHQRFAIRQFADRIRQLTLPQSLTGAIRKHSEVAIIAEVKRRSPSKGPLNASLEPIQIARTYEQSGATGISVITDSTYFSGSVEDLILVRRSATLPILRKDFIIDEIQLYESRAIGADAVLLIVAALDQTSLASLFSKAIELGLEPLVEVHTETEARRALDIGATLIGINNRDLGTFDVSLETTLRLRPLLPASVTVVSESGIHGHDDVMLLGQAGVHAVLVGESLVTAPDPASKLRELIGTGNDPR